MVIGLDGKELGVKKPEPMALNITATDLVVILTALEHLIGEINDYKDMEGAPLDVLADATVALTHIHAFLDESETGVKH